MREGVTSHLFEVTLFSFSDCNLSLFCSLFQDRFIAHKLAGGDHSGWRRAIASLGPAVDFGPARRPWSTRQHSIIGVVFQMGDDDVFESAPQ